MNTDGFVKCNGKVLADKAKLYIELIQPENERLVDEHRANCIKDADVYHRDRSAACDYVQSQAMTDLHAILDPYYVYKPVHRGMFWWRRELMQIKFDLKAAIKEHNQIKDALILKYSNLWRFLPYNWELSLHDFNKVINLAKADRLRWNQDCRSHDWNAKPIGWLDVSSLYQLVNLDDADVFLSIQNYNIFIEASKRYDELMQRKIEQLDAPLHQSN